MMGYLYCVISIDDRLDFKLIYATNLLKIVL